MARSRWVRGVTLHLAVLGVTCLAQSRPAAITPSPVPPRPDPAWIRSYEVLRLRAALPGFLDQINSIPADGNPTSAQQPGLQGSISAAASALTQFESDLATLANPPKCPAALKADASALDTALFQLEGTARPPRTVHYHGTALGAVRSAVSAVANSLGCYAYLAIPARPKSPPYTGSDAVTLHGTVVAAASGQPLPGAGIYLRGTGVGSNPSPDPRTGKYYLENNVFRTAISSATGNWSFADLSPGCYVIEAYEPGRPARSASIAIQSPRYGNCMPPHSFVPAEAGLACGTDCASRTLRLALPSNSISIMAYGPIIAALPFTWASQEPQAPRFSPDGSHFDFLLGGRLWSYNCGAQKLLEVGQVEPPGPVNMTEYRLGWNDHGPIVEQVAPGGPKRYFQAGVAGLMPVLPSAEAVAADFAPAVIETVGTTAGEIAPWEAGAMPAPTTAGPYTVWTQNLGHGSIQLFVGFRGTSQKSIVSGSWALTSSILDTENGDVFYVSNDPQRISVYSLKTKATTFQQLPGSPQALLAAARTPAGVRIAYLARNGCDPPPPGAPSTVRAFPWQVCFVEMPSVAP